MLYQHTDTRVLMTSLSDVYCTAKPKEQKLNQTHHVGEVLSTESLTSTAVENTSNAKLMPHADTNDDDIFADMFSLSSKTKSSAGMSKQSSAATATATDDIFAAEPAASAVKTNRPRHTVQSKKASDVTNVFSVEDDDDDDIFAIKPSSISTAKSSVAATGSSTQKVCVVADKLYY